MPAVREVPAAFERRLRELFPDFVLARYNESVCRFEFIFRSAGNLEVSQFWGWDRNPLTGEPVGPDGSTGLLPFRDLDAVAQQEIIDNCTKTFLGNRHDGAGTWAKQIKERSAGNKALRKARAKQRGEDYAYMIKQVDLRKRWVKDHPRKRKPLIIPG